MIRISKICLLICFQLLSLLLWYEKVACGQKRIPDTGSLQTSPIRAAYFHLPSVEHGNEYLHRLKTHGFNAALIDYGSYHLQESLWQEWGTLAQKYDIVLFPVLRFAVPKELQHSYRPYINRDGEVYQATPCPLDKQYWNLVIGERFKQLATLARTTEIAGALFDTEMYGSDISLYTDLCYCDVCWQRFMLSQPLFTFFPTDRYYTALFLPKTQRFEYLLKHDLFEQYTIFQWQQLQQILSHITSQIQQNHPHFQVGFLGYLYNWFYSALIYGLGMPENPVLVFSESSYVRGYTPYVDREQHHVKSRQAFARYIPGLWLSRFFPEDLPSQLTDLAVLTDGYWLYTADSLWREESRVKWHSLHDTPEAYWTASKQANKELLRLSHFPESAERTIASVYQSSFYYPDQRWLFRPQGLKHVLDGMTGESSALPRLSEKSYEKIFHTVSQSNLPTYRGQTLFHCLNATNGTIQITHVPLGKDTDPELSRSSEDSNTPIEYTVFDEKGAIFREGEIDPQDDPFEIFLPASQGGIASLLINSGVNGAHVAMSGFSCVMEASSTFPLEIFQTEQQYAIYVSSHQAHLKFRAHCPPQESDVITVSAPEQANSETTHIAGFTEFQIAAHPSPKPTFWTVAIAPVPSVQFGDLRLYLYDNEFPYLLPLWHVIQ